MIDILKMCIFAMLILLFTCSTCYSHVDHHKDFFLDDDLDGLDLWQFIHFTLPSNYHAMGDFDSSETIDQEDIKLFASQFGQIVPPEKKSWSIALLPDTQYATERDIELYKEQTQWIADNRELYNIQYVVHVGDIVDNGSYEHEWKDARDAHETIEDIEIEPGKTLQTMTVPGNHDYIKNEPYTRNLGGQVGEGEWNYPDFFDKFVGVPEGDSFEYPANSFDTFAVGDDKYMIVGLEYAPRQSALSWANKKIAAAADEDRNVIIVTHCYQDHNAKRCFCHDAGPYRNDGGGIWAGLISKHSNIRMVLSGHISGASYNEATDTVHGNTVHEILTDYQYEYTNGDENEEVTGNGWLRLLRFIPSQDKVLVSTIKPDSIPHEDGCAIKHFEKIKQTPKGMDGEEYSHQYPHSYYIDYPFKSGLPGDYIDLYVDNSEHTTFGFCDLIVHNPNVGQQKMPSIARYTKGDRKGEYVVAYQEDTNNDHDYAVYIAGFKADGSKTFEKTRMDFINDNYNVDPVVCVDETTGNIVVVWLRDSNKDGKCAVVGSIVEYKSSGSLTEEIIVKEAEIKRLAYARRRWGNQFGGVAVAMGGDGHFTVVWEDAYPDKESYNIHAQTFDSRMRFYPMSEEITVDDNVRQQSDPAVARDSKGNYVVVWEEEVVVSGDERDTQIFMVGYDKSNEVNIHKTEVTDPDPDPVYREFGKNPAIAMDMDDESGNFIIAWERNLWHEYRDGIYIRGYTRKGEDLFPSKYTHPYGGGRDDVPYMRVYKFNIDPTDPTPGWYDLKGFQRNPAISMDVGGNTFTVAWEDDGKDPDFHNNGLWEIFAKTFTFDPEDNGPISTMTGNNIIEVNSVPNGNQRRPAVAVAGGGDFITVWESDGDNDDKYDVYARGMKTDETAACRWP